MQQVIKQNQVCWDKLSQKDVPFSRPKFDLTLTKAKSWLHKEIYNWESLEGKKVLCLASGGGQQGIAFALMGAEVTVVDFSAEQLKKDKQVAQRFNKSIRLVQTDMQDLSMLNDSEFDLVFQPYSINFIPKVDEVFNEVARVLKPNGIYDLMFHNPFVHGSWKDANVGSKWEQSELWRGKGYPIWQPYEDSYPIQTVDPNWNFNNSLEEAVIMKAPQQFKHTLSTMVNGLITRGLEVLNIKEAIGEKIEGKLPGTWEHYKTVAPPWIYVITKKKSITTSSFRNEN